MSGDDLLPADRPLYTIREAGEALRISKRSLLYLLRDGALRRVKIGHSTLIRRDDLAALIAARSSREAKGRD